MIEFIKDGLSFIFFIFFVLLVFLLLLGHDERKKRGESFLKKRENSEDSEGCFVSILNGLGSLFLIIILIATVLGMLYLILRFITYPADRM
jgi:predicted PurR-regulated permease PerM